MWKKNNTEEKILNLLSQNDFFLSAKVTSNNCLIFTHFLQEVTQNHRNFYDLKQLN